MKGRDIMDPIAYTYHADLYCADCGANLPDIDPEGNEKGAVFAGAEFDSIPHCADCGRCIDGHTLTDEGVARAAEQRELADATKEATMIDYLALGSTPYEEECAQVGDEGYRQQALKECAAYIGQLKRMFGEPPAGAWLRTRWFAHDFGTYHEVVVEFEDEPAATEYALKLEGEMPAKWDEQARKELGL